MPGRQSQLVCAAHLFSQQSQERRHPMTLGPIDFLALEFPGNNFRGEILLELQGLVESETIRILDLVIVLKDQDGQVVTRELQELDPHTVQVVDPLKVEVTSMITHDDLMAVAENLENNTTAAVMLFENLWAIKFKQALINANGKLISQQRIPHEVVEEALLDLAALDAAA
jgi:hypothetical protein